MLVASCSGHPPDTHMNTLPYGTLALRTGRLETEQFVRLSAGVSSCCSILSWWKRFNVKNETTTTTATTTTHHCCSSHNIPGIYTSKYIYTWYNIYIFRRFFEQSFDGKHLYLRVFFLYDIPSFCQNSSRTFDPEMHHPATDSQVLSLQLCGKATAIFRVL